MNCSTNEPSEGAARVASGGKMRPWLDPESTKYPNRIFYSGQWRSLEEIERRRKKRRVYDAAYDRERNKRPYRKLERALYELYRIRISS